MVSLTCRPVTPEFTTSSRPSSSDGMSSNSPPKTRSCVERQHVIRGARVVSTEDLSRACGQSALTAAAITSPLALLKAALALPPGMPISRSWVSAGSAGILHDGGIHWCRRSGKDEEWDMIRDSVHERQERAGEGREGGRWRQCAGTP